MKRKLGTIFMLCGAALILSALSLFGYNQWEEQQANQSVVELLPQLIEEIPDTTSTPDIPHQPMGIPVEYLDPSAFEMTEVEIGSYAYIGYLSIPTLELELPIMSSWSYPQLKIAPCRYYGSVRGKDLVLLAHNYRKHFGRIKELSEGDSVFFTDMDGETYEYTVAAKDILEPTAVEEVTAGEYDLALFTCTPGGTSRVTIYCNLKIN